MALLKSIASGNFTSASTWGLCTALNEASTTGSDAVLASTTSYAYVPAGLVSSSVSANAVGVLIKIGARAASPIGTISVALANNAAVILAECTMNLSDVVSTALPVGGSASSFANWLYFKFNSPVAITSGTAYRIGIKTSVASSISYSRLTNGPQSAIVTDVTQAPATNDRLIIVGDNNANPSSPGTLAGTKTACTVTMDSTTTTQYGDGSFANFGIPYWGLFIGDNATLNYANNPSTNYFLRIRGNIAVGSGGDLFRGTLSIGTVANPIDRTSTANLEIDGVAAGQHGLYVQGGNFIAQGSSRTAGKEEDKCLLTANAAASATSLTVDTDTGWLNGDQIYLGQTTRVATNNSETFTLNANAAATTLSLGSGLAVAREGNATIRAAVVLLTRNVNIYSISSAAQWFMYVRNAGSTVDCDWCRFLYLGSSVSTTARLGCHIDNISASSNVNFNKVNFHGSQSSIVLTTTGSGCVVTHCTFTATTSSAINGGFSGSTILAGTSFSNCWIIGAGGGLYFRDYSLALDNFRIVGCTSYAIACYGSTFTLSAPVTWNNFVVHSCNNSILSSNVFTVDLGFLTFNNFEIQRCTAGGLVLGSNSGVGQTTGFGFVFTNSRIWGNTTRNILASTAFSIIFRDCFFASQSGFATAYGVEFQSQFCGINGLVFENCQFGTGFTGAQAHTTSDIFYGLAGSSASPAVGTAILRNCVLGSSTEVSSIPSDSSFIISENHDQVVGAKRIWLKRGVITSDTAIARTGTRSIRLAPNVSTTYASRLEYIVARVAVASGTAPTVGIYVRKSIAGDGAAYNGSQPRLVVKRNILVGINSDTVLATTSAAAGNWELLTATLPTVTADGIVEIAIDCNGTAGWINADDFLAPAAVDTRSFNFTDDTLGVSAYGNNANGGSLLIGKSTLIG
jgi:hypothetical protein